MENACHNHKPLRGTLRQTNDSVVSMEWEIADFKTSQVKRHGDMIAESPTFEMREETWKIRMFNSDSGPEEYKPTVLIELLKRYPEIECRSFICRMMIQINTDEICAGRTRNYRISKGVMYFRMGLSQVDLLELMHGNALKVLCVVLRDPEEYSSNSTNQGIDILASHMKDFFLKGENCDSVIKVNNRDFNVHKAILSARSPVLSAKLHEEENNGTIDIVGSDPKAFESFLLYLYSGHVVELSWENAIQLYSLGYKFDTPHLRKQCVQFMEVNLTTEAFCDVIVLAMKRHESTLFKSAEEFFLKNADSIRLTTKWRLLRKDIPVLGNKLLNQINTTKK